MEYVALGKSRLLVSRTAFGAMTLERLADDAAAGELVAQAYDGGVNFFDVARSA